MKKMLAGLALLVSSAAVQAGGIDLALSNETANLSVLLNPQALYQQQGSELALGGFVSEEGDKLGHVTLLARGFRTTDTTLYNLATGIKLIGGDVDIPEQLSVNADSERVGAVALGFQIGMQLRTERNINPIDVSFEGFAAPSITSFADAERFTEFSARLSIEVIPTARAYVGYRYLRFDTNDYDAVRLDRSVHLGLKISY